MAEGKEFNKKWLIIVAILVLIAIIVVTIILCLPGNPKSAVEALQKDKENNIIADSDVVKAYNNFETKMASSNSIYTQEMSDVQNLLENISVVVDKYNDYALYFEENENFFNNYKPVTTNLNEIQNIKQAIVDELENVEKNYSSSSKDFLRSSWIKIRTNVKNMLDKYSLAFNSLSKIFNESYFGVEQNLASQIAFATVNDYIVVFCDKFGNLCSEDVANSSINNYNYTFSAVIKSFNNYIKKFENYVSGYSYDMLNFYFNEAIESKYEKINSFNVVYNETNFQLIIASAKVSDGEVLFTKTYEGIDDQNNVYQTVKSYLGGE